MAPHAAFADSNDAEGDSFGFGEPSFTFAFTAEGSLLQAETRSPLSAGGAVHAGVGLAMDRATILFEGGLGLYTDVVEPSGGWAELQRGTYLARLGVSATHLLDPNFAVGGGVYVVLAGGRFTYDSPVDDNLDGGLGGLVAAHSQLNLYRGRGFSLSLRLELSGGRVADRWLAQQSLGLRIQLF